jgi:hypothetical protein
MMKIKELHGFKTHERHGEEQDERLFLLDPVEILQGY